jgi:NAD(P)-dependent dehydrogenase (short-subunit alcohol dehydrogenase family)
MGRLDGKLALVTGAGEGMGRAAAQLFANEGARVAVLDIDLAAAQRTAANINSDGGSGVALAADVADLDAVATAVHSAVETLGGLNVVYNNAGVWLAGDGSVTEVTPEVWRRTFAINVDGVYHVCRESIPVMIQGGGGSIINVASINAFRPEPVYDAYAASKGAIVALTRSIAQYHARSKIRANALVPGTMETAMTRDMLRDNQAYREHTLRTHPIGRLGQPEDVAYAALYLASDESSFVTGSMQWVDGGWSLGPELPTFSAEA